MIFRQMVIPRTQCSGQKCPERDGCRRYEQRSPGAPWASFDMERTLDQTEGPCLHRIDLKKRTP